MRLLRVSRGCASAHRARRTYAIAYQIVGQGDVDLVYVPDGMSNLVYGWESPRWRAFYERLARSFRLILFDKRGTGLSDHGPQFAALETRMEDLRAVLDAVGAANTVVLGSHEGCAMAALYAATYPERTRALALFHPVLRGPGIADRATQETVSSFRERWGTQEFADELLREGSPSLYTSEEDRRWWANWLRVGASPMVAATFDGPARAIRAGQAIIAGLDTLGLK